LGLIDPNLLIIVVYLERPMFMIGIGLNHNVIPHLFSPYGVLLFEAGGIAKQDAAAEKENEMLSDRTFFLFNICSPI
jgi:hypothetical protein